VGDAIDAKQKYYFMEEDHDASVLNLDFNIRSSDIKYSTPTHFISGNRLNFELMKMFSGSCAAAEYNFDQLMISFRCVATDIDKSKLVILKEGSLCRSVRASMTFPFILDPIRIDGKLLFDGGMKDNFPVSVAIEEFDPDFIIGSKAAGNYDPPQEDDLLSIIQNMLTDDAEYSTMGKKGAILDLELPSIDIIDFSQTKRLIDAAYEQTKKYLAQNPDLFPKRTKSIAEERHRFKSKIPNFKLDAVYLEWQDKNQNKNTIKRREYKTKPSNFKEIETDYFRTAAHPAYAKTSVAMPFDFESESYNLIYQLKLRKPFSMDFGGNISSSNLTQAYLKLSYQKMKKNRFSSYINGYFGQFYRSAKAQLRYDVAGRIPVSFKVSATFNYKNYFRGTTYFFEDDEAVYLKEDQRFISIEGGIPFKADGRIFMGLSSGANVYKYYQSNNFSKTDTTDKTILRFFYPSLSFDINNLNKKQFANRGLQLSCQLLYSVNQETYVPGSNGSVVLDPTQNQSFIKLKVKYINYFLHAGATHLGIRFDGALSNQQLLLNYTSSILSASQFNPIIGLEGLFIRNLRAYSFGSVGLILNYDLLHRLSLRIESFYYQPYQRIIESSVSQTYLEKPFSSRYLIGAGAVVYDTRIGPLSLQLTYTDANADRWAVLFSFGYVLFNKSVW
jgi:NTE family protein